MQTKYKYKSTIILNYRNFFDNIVKLLQALLHMSYHAPSASLLFTGSTHNASIQCLSNCQLNLSDNCCTSAVAQSYLSATGHRPFASPSAKGQSLTDIFHTSHTHTHRPIYMCVCVKCFSIKLHAFYVLLKTLNLIPYASSTARVMKFSVGGIIRPSIAENS